MARRRSALVALGVAVIGALAVGLGWRWCGGAPAERDQVGERRRGSSGARAVRPGRRLDVERFRAHLAGRRAAAARLPRRSLVEPYGARPPRGRLAETLVAPRCILGPGELCAQVSDTLDACDAGDAEACLAAAQYLEDHPPRPMVVIGVYHRGCRLGSAAACARFAELREPTRTTAELCADDPLACSWVGMRTRDREALDQACADGVADACITVFNLLPDDDAAARDYATVACELGSPMACGGLALALSPDCTEDCYHPPDPAQAAAAAIVACESGFTELCPDR